MKRWIAISALVVCVVLLAADAGYTEPGAEQLSQDQRFVLKNPDGGSVSLDKLLKKNKAVLLNFWATWCPYCVREIPDLVKLQREYSEKSFTVLGIDVDESPAKVKSFMKKKGMNYPVAIDKRGDIAGKFEIRGIPTTILVRSDGEVLGVYHEISRELLSDIEAALA